MPDYRIRVLQTAGSDAVIQVIGEVDLVGSYAFRERLSGVIDAGGARGGRPERDATVPTPTG